MNQLQKIEFDLLRCFVDVCDALGLCYYLVCGSALGAVKYKGFIPWDDDIDVALPRPDYERFLKEAPSLMPEHVFLQNYKTDPSFPTIFSKLRDSRTTYIEKSVSLLPINHGVYIDVFPLDGYPESTLEGFFLELKKKMYRRLLSVAFLPNASWKKLVMAPLRALGIHKKTLFFARSYETLVSRYPVDGSQVIANHGNWQGNLDYSPVEEFGEGVLADFEGIKVRIPSDYDTYLRRKYDDYWKDLPEEEQVGHHYFTVCDCDKPYTEYGSW